MPDDSKAIEAAKKLFEVNEIDIRQELAIIKSNFKVLKDGITELEERLSLCESMKIVQKVRDSLSLEPFSSKLDLILKKNPGFERLMMFASVHDGKTVSGLEEDPATISNFKFAPVTSVDCERAFSLFKDLISSKRLRMTEEHLRDQMMIQWNRELME